MGAAMPDSEQFVAIIGMAGRFPGAADLDAFWANLAGGVESSETLAAQDEFDAGFFGIPDSSALLLDPQHRVFLETCWAALEDAGYDPADVPGAIGVYAGSSDTDYQSALRTHRDRLAFASDWQIRIATGRDFLTSRVAYKLGLRGPAVTVQTACSTSLVATHLAGQALLGGDCDLALAGGVTVHLWSDTESGGDDAGLVAPDGHCRSFDADAAGTVFANGVGVLVLKRFADARRDRDHIWAVIRGSAVNNDGLDKIGFAAPSIDGQAAVIRDAQLAAGVDPANIGYVEAHGTGTPLGDPIEIAALTKAFRRATDQRGYCPIGSVKTNIGHVDAAAGVAGVIKTVLAMRHGILPPSLNFRAPNPRCDLADSPFFVPTEPRPWRRDRGPRQAGVSALGIGGTNAHLILEEAPDTPAPAIGPPCQLLVVSARTGSAVARAATRLGTHLREHRHTELADVAWTLQVGRRAHAHRRFAVCADHDTAAAALARITAEPDSDPVDRPVAFAFPGQGGQHLGMCRELYEHAPGFRVPFDECADLAMAAGLDIDLRDIVRPERAPVGGRIHDQTLHGMNVAQPAVFAAEYALAGLLRGWGVRPDVLVGHSLGAYAAATVAGVFSLPDAMGLVVERGRLLHTVEVGAMAAVPLPEADLMPMLTDDLDLAVVNGPAQCVVAGPRDAVGALLHKLADLGIDATVLRIPAPAHSRYVEPIMAAFDQRVGALRLHPPSVPVLSEITGSLLSVAEITDPAYWSAHLRRTVRFGAALSTLFGQPDRMIVEVGPGHALSTIARRHPGRPPGVTAVPTLPHAEQDDSALATLLTAVGTLWSAGTPIDWTALHEGRPRHRVSLPTYPFERRRYTVDPPVWFPAATGRSIDPASGNGTLAGPPPPAETPAATNRETQVGDLYRQVLGVASVEPRDSFFALGGDSVIAAQLVRLVRHTFAIPVPLRAIFRNPTVADLARYVDEQLVAPLATPEQGVTRP
jgi:phthiocerol/phenolphthiocerol synthesis type-I polyketide synthase E